MIYLILAAALLVRFLVYDLFWFPTWDGAFYINYFIGDSWKWVLHPGYPWAIQIMPFQDGVVAAQMVSIFSSVWATYALYRLSKHYLTEVPSLVASGLFALSPLVIHYSVLTYSESLYTLIILWAVERFSAKKYRMSGALFGLSYLVRPEGLLIAGALVIYLAIKKNFRPATQVIVFSSLLAVPYIAQISIEQGSLTLTKKTMNIRSWSPDWKVNVANEGRPAEASVLEEYPARAAQYGEFLYSNLGPIVLASCVVGVIFYPTPALAGLASILILPAFGLNPSDRLIVPYIPFILFFAVSFASHWRLTRRLLVLLYLAFAASIFLTFNTATRPEEQDQGAKDVGTFFSSHPGLRFLDRKPYLAFYAKGVYVPIPNAPIDSVVSFLRTDADYLVLSTRVIPIFRPQLNPLFRIDTAAAHGLEPALGTSEMIIYKTRGAK